MVQFSDRLTTLLQRVGALQIVGIDGAEICLHRGLNAASIRQRRHFAQESALGRKEFLSLSRFTAVAKPNVISKIEASLMKVLVIF